MSDSQKIFELYNKLLKININNDKEYYKKIQNIRIVNDYRDKNDPEFYYKTIVIGNMGFYYIHFNNGTEDGEHFLNINKYKIIGTSKNEKLSQKYKNNISFLYEEMNFPVLTETMFILFINEVFNFIKI